MTAQLDPAALEVVGEQPVPTEGAGKEAKPQDYTALGGRFENPCT